MASPQQTAAEDLAPQVTVAFVGHHQSGKSTTAGHLILKLGGLDKRAQERLERETSNRPTSRYAWVLDRLRPERDRAMTCDLKLFRITAPATAAAAAAVGAAASEGGGRGAAAKSGPAAAASALGGSSSLDLTLMDTPGHPDYLRNAIAAITQSDLAVLVVDSRPAVMDAPSTVGQTRDLAMLALNLANYRTMVVAVNHLDGAIESDVAEQRFTDAAAALTKLLKRKEGLSFVPVSGLAGDNLAEASPRTPWWRGPTLVEAIVAAAATGAGAARGTAAAAELPLRMPVIAVFKVGGIGTVAAGRLAGGRLTRGSTAALVPAPKGWHATASGAADTSAAAGGATASFAAAGAAATVAIRSLESFHESLAGAAAGNFVGVAVKGMATGALRRGCVMCDAATASEGAGSGPALAAEEFTARIQVVRDPTSQREGHERHMRLGYCAVVHVHTAQALCRLISIKRFNTKGEVLEEVAQHLQEGDIAEVRLVPLKPLVVEPFKDYPALGRFAVRATMRQADPMSTVNGNTGSSGGGRREVVVAIGRVEHVKRRSADSPAAAKKGLSAVHSSKKAAQPSPRRKPESLEPALAPSSVEPTAASDAPPSPSRSLAPPAPPQPEEAAEAAADARREGDAGGEGGAVQEDGESAAPSAADDADGGLREVVEMEARPTGNSELTGSAREAAAQATAVAEWEAASVIEAETAAEAEAAVEAATAETAAEAATAETETAETAAEVAETVETAAGAAETAAEVETPAASRERQETEAAESAEATVAPDPCGDEAQPGAVHDVVQVSEEGAPEDVAGFGPGAGPAADTDGKHQGGAPAGDVGAGGAGVNGKEGDASSDGATGAVAAAAGGEGCGVVSEPGATAEGDTDGPPVAEG